MFLFFSFKWSKLVNVPGQNEVLFFKKFPRCYVEMTFTYTHKYLCPWNCLEFIAQFLTSGIYSAIEVISQSKYVFPVICPKTQDFSYEKTLWTLIEEDNVNILKATFFKRRYC